MNCQLILAPPDSSVHRFTWSQFRICFGNSSFCLLRCLLCRCMWPSNWENIYKSLSNQQLTCNNCSKIWLVRYKILVGRVAINSWCGKRYMTIVGRIRTVFNLDDCCRVIQIIYWSDEHLSRWTCIRLTISRASDNRIQRKDWKIGIDDCARYGCTFECRLGIGTCWTRSCNRVN